MKKLENLVAVHIHTDILSKKLAIVSKAFCVLKKETCGATNIKVVL